MKITKEELEAALDNLFDPYPAFTESQLKKDWIAQQTQDNDDITFMIQDHENGGQGDIADDIQNCGRNPLSKFMEQAKNLYLLRIIEPTIYGELMEYITKHINEHG